MKLTAIIITIIVMISFCLLTIEKIEIPKSKDSNSFKIEGDWITEEGIKLKFIQGEVWYSGKVMGDYKKLDKNLWEIIKSNHPWKPFEDIEINGHAIIESGELKLHLDKKRNKFNFWLKEVEKVKMKRIINKKRENN